jgi:hypothetical protein
MSGQRLPGPGGVPLDAASVKPRPCVNCGNGTHRVEMRGVLVVDRFNPLHFFLMNPLQQIVCVVCGHQVTKDDAPEPPKGEGLSNG